MLRRKETVASKLHKYVPGNPQRRTSDGLYSLALMCRLACRYRGVLAVVAVPVILLLEPEHSFRKYTLPVHL